MSYCYLFRVVGTEWLKFGSTDCATPWKRARRGFWTNRHPDALCNKLGYYNLELLLWCRGSRQAEEATQKMMRAGEDGKKHEFWPVARLEEIKQHMKGIALGAGATEDDWELPVVPRPTQPPDGAPRRLEMLGCCTGRERLKCPHCPYEAGREHHLRQHLTESCPELGLTNKIECVHCGSMVKNKRLMGQHQQTQKCKKARVQRGENVSHA